MSWLSEVARAGCEPVALYLRYVRAMATLKKGSGSRILYPGVISIGKGCSIVIGCGSYVGAYSEIAVTECLCSEAGDIGLRIGNNTAIGAFANIRAHGNPIRIGNGVLIGQNVSIISSGHAKADDTGRVSRFDIDQKVKRPLVICDGAWVGAGAIILPGVTVGENAIVGAGAVVAKDVGANETWIGYSARRMS